MNMPSSSALSFGGRGLVNLVDAESLASMSAMIWGQNIGRIRAIGCAHSAASSTGHKLAARASLLRFGDWLWAMAGKGHEPRSPT